MEFAKLQEIMQQNGIVGAGGAGFPSYAKLNMAADTIILNCAECEPLLTLHRQVLAKYAYEIMSTLEQIADACEAKEVIIGVKPSYKEAVAAVKANLVSFKKTRIGLLPEVYPAGDEVVLIYETTGRVVNPGALPITVGVTVFNVETILNVYNAINNNAPVTTKYITITGAVKNPVTLKAPLGITYGELIDLAGGPTIKDFALIAGGPMTGRITSLTDTVTKTSNAVLVLPSDHYCINKRLTKPIISVKRAMSACCQCRMCTDLCPRNLLGHPIQPHAFMRAISSGSAQDIKPLINSYFCVQCGVCEYFSCPQGLAPKTLLGEYKGQIRAAGVPMPKVEATGAKEARSMRLLSKERLTERLGLARYDAPAPLIDSTVKTEKVRISASQHIGAPAQPCVKSGDKVKAGQPISLPMEGKLGVPVHSPVNGTVVDVNPKFITIQVD